MSEDFRLWLLSKRAASWELPFIAGHTSVDVSDVAAMIEVGRGLAVWLPVAGVLCYDEMRILEAALLANALGLPTAAPEAVRRCRDKSVSRRLIGQVASVPVATVVEAARAAERIGYPVIVKPCALAASEGVVRVDDPRDIAPAFAFAAGAYRNFGQTPTEDRGVLVEEFLDGPEIAVDSVVWRGVVTPAFISHKRMDIVPTFEETGHLVDAEDPLLEDLELREVVQAAHSAVGFEHGMTHTEVRLTAKGPRIVELNARLGGDLIPYVGLLATGIDLALAAACLAAGLSPDITPGRRRVAAVRYLYPDCDMVLESVRINHRRLPRGIWQTTPLAQPGATLLRPPGSFVKGRAALGYAVGEDVTACEEALAQLADVVEIRGHALA